MLQYIFKDDKGKIITIQNSMQFYCYKMFHCLYSATFLFFCMVSYTQEIRKKKSVIKSFGENNAFLEYFLIFTVNEIKVNKDNLSTKTTSDSSHQEILYKQPVS